MTTTDATTMLKPVEAVLEVCDRNPKLAPRILPLVSLLFDQQATIATLRIELAALTQSKTHTAQGKHSRAKVAACARWRKTNPNHICEVCTPNPYTHTEENPEKICETGADQGEQEESHAQGQKAMLEPCNPEIMLENPDKRKISPPTPPPIKENYYSQGPPESPPNGEDAQAQPSLPLGPEPGSCEPPAASATLGDVELEPVSATGRTFDEFWEQYPGHPGGKGHKGKAKTKWAALSKARRDEAFTVATTIAANSDRYLPDAQRFLSPTSEKSWKTLLDQETLTPETRQRGLSNSKFDWKAYDQQLRDNADNPDFWNPSSPTTQPEPPQPEEPEDPALAALMF